ncbi:MAG: exopolysaccharide biosynthesis protein [Beijerinckiaceae bacterium]
MPPQIRISDLLSHLVNNGHGETIRFGSILEVLGTRAFALLMVLFALPNCIPMVPPIPLISGLLIAGLAVQLVAGWRTPWLPRRIRNYEVKTAEVKRLVERATPMIHRLERFARPRLSFFEWAPFVRLIGIAVLIMALSLLVAAPIIGQIPLGLAIALVGVGLVERDGVLVTTGFIIGAIGVAISASFIFAIILGIDRIF